MKVDFHTHSTGSKDGGLTLEQYKHLISKHKLDLIAITDHNSIKDALEIKRQLPEHIIVGEEVMTQDGEIIGLFIADLIPPYLTLEKTVEIIKKRGGLVYVPHPFETVRSGLSLAALNRIAKDVDIVEVVNGRTLQNKSSNAKKWVKNNPHVVAAAGSDAHSKSGAGKTYTVIDRPNKLSPKSLMKRLEHSKLVYKRPPLRAFAAPKVNRVRSVIK